MFSRNWHQNSRNLRIFWQRTFDGLRCNKCPSPLHSPDFSKCTLNEMKGQKIIRTHTITYPTLTLKFQVARTDTESYVLATFETSRVASTLCCARCNTKPMKIHKLFEHALCQWIGLCQGLALSMESQSHPNHESVDTSHTKEINFVSTSTAILEAQPI